MVAIMFLLFGTAHFMSPQAINRMVPKYINWPLFWTYIAGIALVGSGISFIAHVKVKWIGLLLGITLFLWVVMLHVYYAVRFPHFQDGENVIGSFEALAFCGTARAISQFPLLKNNDADVNKVKRTTSIEPVTGAIVLFWL